MKLLCIPDIHQDLSTFEKYADFEKYQKIILIGDYCDAWESKEWWMDLKHNPIQILKKLVNLKKKYPDILELCLGNHDWAYFGYDKDSDNVSGHQHLHHAEIREFFIKNKEFFKIAYGTGKYLFSHAGFSDDFVTSLEANPESAEDIANKANAVYLSGEMNFDHRGFDPYGDDRTERCLWIRPNALATWNGFKGVQIVGHTECGLLKIVHEDEIIYIADSRNHEYALEIDTDADEIKPLGTDTITEEIIPHERVLEARRKEEEYAKKMSDIISKFGF
ncbi:MAG: metallophosphoesterase [Clostridia bacterium]|nr:metallophosphoesterase [Clostridia bacterium]